MVKFKYIILVVFLNNFYFPSQSQECYNTFVNGIKEANIKNHAKFKKISEKYIKRSVKKLLIDKKDLENLTIINIPLVFCREDFIWDENSRTEDILCYLSNNNLEFDEALIFKDSILIGTILPCGDYKCKYEVLNSDVFYTSFIEPLAKSLKEIQPDLIFKIYNVSQTYWYLKDDKLYTLSFVNEKREIKNIKIFEATEYINNYMHDNDIMFMSPKRVKVVSGY